MNLTNLRPLLEKLDIRPSRKLGQNFLVDENVCRWIVSQLEAGPEDVVVEIGPGAGALTEHLVGKVRRLILIEKDSKFAAHHAEVFADDPSVEVIDADATQYDVRPLFREGKVKVIGNLPYSAGTEIMRNFLDAPTPVERAVFMVQKEVALRICAEPKTKAFGVLTLMLRRIWAVGFLKTVGPELFHPRPEVESSIIRFDPLPEDRWPAHCPESFAEVAKKGFAQRRKQLQNNLKLSAERWKEISGAMGLSTMVRAEELSVREWVELSNHLEEHPCSQLPPSDGELLDVVNENDEVVEQVVRKEIHERGLLHRAIHIFVFNRGGDLYLQQRSQYKDTHAGAWGSSAAGHVDAGESYLESAIRELEEELWIVPKKDLELIAKIPASDATDQEFVELYHYDGFKGRAKTHGKEVVCGGFFNVEEIGRWIEDRPSDFTPGFKTCFQSYLKWKEPQS